MAKFRDSTVHATDHVEAHPRPINEPEQPSLAVQDRSIGDILRDFRQLTAEQVEKILQYQRERSVRFGEAAVALGFATPDDVLYALSRQFHYPYAPEDRRKLNPELVVLNQPFSREAEAFRAIRTQVMMRLYPESQLRHALAVVSPDAGDGKTFFAANLGAALAQLGSRTLIIDANLRAPRMHEVFNIENRAGLSSILSGRAESQVIQQVADIPTLFILPAGATPPNPLELVERHAFALLLGELMSKFDQVVVDTPAAVYGADASVIAARCASTLIVARRNKSRIADLQGLVSSIGSSAAAGGGVVMNEY